MLAVARIWIVVFCTSRSSYFCDHRLLRCESQDVVQDVKLHHHTVWDPLGRHRFLMLIPRCDGRAYKVRGGVGNRRDCMVCAILVYCLKDAPTACCLTAAYGSCHSLIAQDGSDRVAEAG
jgi:hypothetical protein